MDGFEVKPDNSDEYSANKFAKLILVIPAEILVKLFELSTFKVIFPSVKANFGFFVVSNEVDTPPVSVYVTPYVPPSALENLSR